MQNIQWDKVPEKYKKWTLEYDSSIQSYKQLKSGAQFIFNKFKSNNSSNSRTNNVNLNAFEVDNDEDGDENSGDIDNKEVPVDVHNEFDDLVIGSHGEVYKINENFIHVYDWIPRNSINKSVDLNNKTLYHIHTIKTPECSKISKILKIFPVYYNRITKNLKILYILKTSINYELYLFDLLRNQEDYLPFKINSNFGYFSTPVDSSDYFILIDKTNQILNVFDYENLSLVNKFNVEFINDVPIFDLRGKHLIFNINSKFRYLINKNQLNSINLSSKNNLLNKLIKSFSNTALDSMLLFSEVSQNKISKILENRKKQQNNDTTSSMDQNETNEDGNDCDDTDELINDDIRDNYRDIFIELYNTINKSSSYVKLVDLSINSTIFQLSIPMGCSKISISPFDLQFLTVNYRGDELYLWDFTNLNNDSIILIDKYIRGKTSSIIETIDWGIGNSTVLCLSRQNGSLHSFINESLRNYEDLKIRKKNGSSNATNKTQKPWCLSSLKLKNFRIIRIVFILDYIIGVDRDNNLLLINLATGNIEGFIDIKNFKKQGDNVTDIDSICLESEIKSQVITTLTNKEIEIETCKPYLPSYNNKNYNFHEIENFGIDFNNFINLSENIKIKKTFKIGAELYENKFSEIDTPLTPITPVTSIPKTADLTYNQE